MEEMVDGGLVKSNLKQRIKNDIINNRRRPNSDIEAHGAQGDTKHVNP